MATLRWSAWLAKRWHRWLELRLPRRSSVKLTQKNTFIFPTLQGFAVVAVCLLLFIAGINYENNSILALTFFIVALFFLSIHLTFFNLSGLSIQVGKSHPGFCGDNVGFEIFLQSDTRARWVLWVSNDYSTQRISLQPGERKSVQLSERGMRRGRQLPQRILIETRAPLGWIRAWTWFAADTELLVYPKPVATQEWVFAGKGQHDGLNVAPRGQDLEFQGIREFQPGDPLKHIYWKGYARTGQILSKHFASDESSGSELSESRLHHLDKEMRMSMLCWWVLYLAEHNQSWSLALDDHSLPAGAGETQRERSLYLLAVSGERR